MKTDYITKTVFTCFVKNVVENIKTISGIQFHLDVDNLRRKNAILVQIFSKPRPDLRKRLKSTTSSNRKISNMFQKYY